MCNCIDIVNKKLIDAGQNTKISEPIFLSFDGKEPTRKVILATEKADKNDRKKPSSLFATFCPFCGINYSAELEGQGRAIL